MSNVDELVDNFYVIHEKLLKCMNKNQKHKNTLKNIDIEVMTKMQNIFKSYKDKQLLEELKNLRIYKNNKLFNEANDYYKNTIKQCNKILLTYFKSGIIGNKAVITDNKKYISENKNDKTKKESIDYKKKLIKDNEQSIKKYVNALDLLKKNKLDTKTLIDILN